MNVFLRRNCLTYHPGCHLGGGTTQLHMEKWKHFSILNWPRSLKSKQAAITAINYYRGKEQERENMNERKWEQQKGWIRGEWWGWGEGHKRERDGSEMRGEMVRRGEWDRMEGKSTHLSFSLSVKKPGLFAYKPNYNKSSLWGLLEEKMRFFCYIQYHKNIYTSSLMHYYIAISVINTVISK